MAITSSQTQQTFFLKDQRQSKIHGISQHSDNTLKFKQIATATSLSEVYMWTWLAFPTGHFSFQSAWSIAITSYPIVILKY